MLTLGEVAAIVFVLILAILAYLMYSIFREVHACPSCGAKGSVRRMVANSIKRTVRRADHFEPVIDKTEVSLYCKKCGKIWRY